MLAVVFFLNSLFAVILLRFTKLKKKTDRFGSVLSIREFIVSSYPYNLEDFGVDFLIITFSLHLALLFPMDLKIVLTDNMGGSSSLRRFINTMLFNKLS